METISVSMVVFPQSWSQLMISISLSWDLKSHLFKVFFVTYSGLTPSMIPKRWRQITKIMRRGSVLSNLAMHRWKSSWKQTSFYLSSEVIKYRLMVTKCTNGVVVLPFHQSWQFLVHPTTVVLTATKEPWSSLKMTTSLPLSNTEMLSTPITSQKIWTFSVSQFLT